MVEYLYRKWHGALFETYSSVIFQQFHQNILNFTIDMSQHIQIIDNKTRQGKIKIEITHVNFIRLS